VSEGRHTVAAICGHGHVATDAVEHYQPGRFCADCGAELITACPNCRTPIRGDYHVPGVFALSTYTPPAYCFNCGKPFPWTAEKLSAANELADELDGMNADDREKLKAAISDVAAGGPRAEVGAARIKRLLGRASTGARQALWKISVDVASEAAKKILLGG
jgi:hypothetical protein